MKTYLLRHARAVPAAQWKGDDLLRPLDEAGRAHAERLRDHFAAEPPTRIVSAPSVRCQQTLQPLAAALGLEVEIDERLAPGEPVARALELLPTFDDGPLLLCTHAAPIVALLRVLELVDDDRPECRKGSVWVLEGRGYTPSHASYRAPARRVREADRAGADVAAGPGTEDGRVRAAVLDLGSTSFNLLIADVGLQGSIASVVREKVMLRLGAVLAEGASIPEDVCERAVEVARELSEVARREKVERFLPVGTAALRAAANGCEVARRIGAAFGHPIRILSGEEEARLIFRAFQQRLSLGSAVVAGVDLGGGSLEVALGSGAGVEQELTLELGVVRLHGTHVRHDPMKKSEMRALQSAVRTALEPHAARFARRDASVAIATGGTVRALARIVDERAARRAPRPQGLRLEHAALRALRKRLVASDHEQRMAIRGIRKGRADLLPTGAVILETVAETLGFDGYRVCDWGLREGVLLDAVLPGPQ